MNKRLFVSLFLILAIFFALPGSVSAGGFNVELTPKNIGIAGSTGVNVEIYTGAIDRTAFNVGYEFRLTYLNPMPSQKCYMTKSTSDAAGLASGICYSDIPGTFEIYPEVHNYSVETGEWWNMGKSIKTAIQFERNIEEPTLMPEPTSSSFNQSQLEAKVEELEKKVEKQDEDISFLQKMVSRLMEMLTSLWPF